MVKGLIPFRGTVSHIPSHLAKAKRWAPWAGKYNVKRNKWDKIPRHAHHPTRGLSTANPDGWFELNDALKAFHGNQGSLHGIGYVMTKPHGVVGVDLDNCVEEGVVADWAADVVRKLGSYAEFSPSGTGVRIFVLGKIDTDWVNHQIGIEVYQGDHPRFLTVTGAHLPGTPTELTEAPPGVLQELANTWREKPSEKATDKSQPRPLALPEKELPALEDLDLSPMALAFLRDGDPGERGDKSRALYVSAIGLAKAGLNETQVYSVLLANDHAYEVALGHREYKAEKAENYLWQHHVLTAMRVATKSVLTEADFELAVDDGDDDDGVSPVEGGGVDADDVQFEAVTDMPEDKPKYKYKLHQLGAFARQQVTIDWMIQNVLPKSELGVVFGPSGSGKTFFVLDLLVCIAAGRSWRGRRVRKARSIIYIAAEGAVGLRLRIRALCEFWGIDPDTLPIYIIDAAPNVLEKEDVKALVASIRGQYGKCDLVVTDTLSQVTAGANENSSEDMGRALANFKLMGRALGAMMLLVGHTGKDDSRGQRGWSGIRGALDVEIQVLRGPTFRSATITKLKDGEGEGTEFVFNLQQVPIEVWTEEDELIGPELVTTTSCVCAYEEDTVAIEVLKAEAKAAEAKARSEKRGAYAQDREANGVGGNAKYLRDVLEEKYLAGLAEVPEDTVRKAFKAAYAIDHPGDDKGAGERQAWKRLVMEGGMAKFAVKGDDGRFRLLNPPPPDTSPPPWGDD